MFGLGFGEILVILFVAFLINPRELPDIMRKIVLFMRNIKNFQNYLLEIKDDVEEAFQESKDEIDAVQDDIKSALNLTDKSLKRQENDTQKLGTKERKK